MCMRPHVFGGEVMPSPHLNTPLTPPAAVLPHAHTHTTNRRVVDTTTTTHTQSPKTHNTYLEAAPPVSMAEPGVKPSPL